MKMYSLAISVPEVSSLEQTTALDRILHDPRALSWLRTREESASSGRAVENYLIRYCLEE